MTVRELQALLDKCNPDQDVVFQMSDGCCGDSREMVE